MIYVLDASVALKWVLNESETRNAVRLRNDFRHDVHDLIAPDIDVTETAPGLTKAERRGILPVGMAERRMLTIFPNHHRLVVLALSANQSTRGAIQPNGRRSRKDSLRSRLRDAL